MLTNAAFARATARHRHTLPRASEVRAERLRAIGFSRADLFLAVMRGMR